MQYQEFLKHIYQRYSGNVKLELDRMAGLLADMGNPQNELKGFQVAGTNGKGSVCASLEALALAHGKTVGLNTSPHLINYTERFRINGHELDYQTILTEFLAHEALFQKWEASFFEISTAIAFELFYKNRVECTIMEVGLGGRLDATNLFSADAAVITNIGLDHVKSLGDSIEKIAFEKAGIIKENQDLVIGKVEDSALEVILEQAEKKQARVYRYAEAWEVRLEENSRQGPVFDYSFGDIHLKRLSSNLLGAYQALNMGAALTAYILFCQKHGIELKPEAIRSGLMQINWPGRMQILGYEPLLIVDGAHNIHGVQALVNSLKEIFGPRKFTFLLSILGDKRYSEILGQIAAIADSIYVAQNKSDRAASVEEQMQAMAGYDIRLIAGSSVEKTLHLVLKEAKKDDIIIAGGSLFTVGEVISAYKDYV